MSDQRSVTTANICFECEKACGSCSWSEVLPNGDIRFEVPEGAIFEPVFDKVKPERIITHHIIKCPLFEQTPARVQTNGMISEVDNKIFLKDPIRYLDGTYRNRRTGS